MALNASELPKNFSSLTGWQQNTLFPELKGI